MGWDHGFVLCVPMCVCGCVCVYRTQGQGSEIDGVAVGAVASLIACSDLEGVDGAGSQRVDGHSVSLTVHTHCTVLI